MEILGNPVRPGRWAEMSRVAFIAHGLMPDYLSTVLIDQRLEELGLDWPGKGEEPGFAINWFSFPVYPQYVEGWYHPTWVDFYIIPVLAPTFLKACYDGQAYKWSESVALAAIDDAQKDGVKLTVGWGALTKVATNHGQLFLENHPELADKFSSTHGDAGTASLVIQTLQQIGVQRGARVAVLGANGAIGDVVSRALPQLQPESILLVGKADRPGENKKFARLEDLQQRVLRCINGSPISVGIHQNKSTACYDHNSDVVIVATIGMDLIPSEIPVGALVLDMTTPAACQPDPDWHGRLVLTAGCGEFTNEDILPDWFGRIDGDPTRDVGAGGDLVVWGCTGETIARSVFGWKGHLVGTNIPLDAMEWVRVHFNRLGFAPQPYMKFNRLLEDDVVRGFVSSSRETRHLRQALRSSTARVKLGGLTVKSRVNPTE